MEEVIIRKQPTAVSTGKKKIVLVISIIALLLIGAGVLIYLANNRPYVPPKFEENAVDGIPEVDESVMFAALSSGYDYSLGISFNLYQQEDNSLDVYFTNPETNDCNLMIEILDAETEKTYYKSGVLTPGQYVKNLPCIKDKITETTKILIYVYAFEPETWYSEGTYRLITYLQPW